MRSIYKHGTKNISVSSGWWRGKSCEKIHTWVLIYLLISTYIYSSCQFRNLRNTSLACGGGEIVINNIEIALKIFYLNSDGNKFSWRPSIICVLGGAVTSTTSTWLIPRRRRGGRIPPPSARMPLRSLPARVPQFWHGLWTLGYEFVTNPPHCSKIL